MIHILIMLQSFADMWVDFLLKESEEREKRESSENIDTGSKDNSSGNSEFSTVPLASPDSDPRFSRQIPRY